MARLLGLKVSARYLAALLACVVAASASWAAWTTFGQAGDPSKDILTVEQTLGLAFTQSFDTPTIHLFARANPGAKEAVRHILAKDDLQMHHGRAWLILGFIGENSDVERIERATKSGFSEVLSRAEYESLSMMLRALGILCRREVHGACELLVRMQNPSYWKAAGFQLYDRPMPQRPPFEYEMIIYVMNAYSLSRRPDLEERALAVLDAIEDPSVRGMMSAALDSKRLVAYGDQAFQDEHRRPFSEELRSLEHHFNGNLNDLGPKTPEGPVRPVQNDGASAVRSSPSGPPQGLPMTASPASRGPCLTASFMLQDSKNNG